MEAHDIVPLDKNNKARPLPVYEDFFAKPEPQHLMPMLLPNVSSSSGSVIGAEDVEETPAKWQKLDMNHSLGSEPDIGQSSFGFGAQADSSKKTNKSRYAAGTAEGQVDTEMQSLLADVAALLDNLWDDDRRKAALGQRLVNNKTADIKTLVEKAKPTKNPDLISLAIRTRDGWSTLDSFLKSCKDYGFELKLPRAQKIPMFLR